ncbi:MAG: tyrosine-type recombinase/integrase [Pseudomonadota bacterium]
MASIREKGPQQWQAQVRRSGWPSRNATFRTKKSAQAWARKIEHEVDEGLFLDQREAEAAHLRDLILLYLEVVTAHRPSENSRIAEASRLKRILREEKRLCAHAVINLTPEHFEDYRDRRLRHRQKNGKLLSGATVNKELMLFKQVINFRKRKLGLAVNPVNTTDVKRVAVNDERDVRLSASERERLLQACSEMRNPLLRPFVEIGFETGARRGSLLRLEWRDVNLKARTALLRAIKNSRSPNKIINHAIGWNSPLKVVHQLG